MIIHQRILDFESMGLGMFVHFGLYSLLGKGEWAKCILKISDREYEPLMYRFAPSEGWAEELVTAAKAAGCRYITLTTRHHDGFSLYDTRGLSDYDAPHGCGRDLVREFVDACRAQDIQPFFYHTLVDWHVSAYQTDFPAYLRYLRQSVAVLCANYGPVGGFWFDGIWDKPDADWEEDALYSMIRSYQPDTMIIHNSGMEALGKVGHPELDSVTFERGKPRALKLGEEDKYVASEMCQVFGDHWGYAGLDLNYKSMATIIEELACCRRYRANMLMNVGPMGDGSLRPLDKAMLETLGTWVHTNEEAVHSPLPTEISIEGREKDFILRGEDGWYLFVHNPETYLPMGTAYPERFPFEPKITSVRWLDNGHELTFTQKDGVAEIDASPAEYGTNLVVRVAKIITE